MKGRAKAMARQLSIANLEMGQPTVEAAMKALSFELRHARSVGCTVLKVIHGYGSSGAGGKIRTAARKRLGEMLAKGQVKAVVWGEDFSIFDENTRRLLQFCGELRKDTDLERRNQGVTLVLL